MSGAHRKRWGRGVVLACGVVTFAGCSGSARREAALVLEATDRFRKADDPRKPALAEALGAVSCSAADVCRARDACLASATPTAQALRRKSEVELGLLALERDAMAPDSPEARALPAKLDEAEALLKEGFAALPACDDRLMALRRAYQL